MVSFTVEFESTVVSLVELFYSWEVSLAVAFAIVPLVVTFVSFVVSLNVVFEAVWFKLPSTFVSFFVELY